MSDALAIRTTVETQLNNVGESVIVTPRTATTDKWGTKTYTNGSTYSIVVAPDDFLDVEIEATDRGLLDNSSMVVVTGGSNTVANDSLLTIDGSDYVVLSTEEFIIDGVVIAMQLVLGEFNG